LCYWGAPVDVQIAPKSLLLCSPSCDDSQRHGWWITLASDKGARVDDRGGADATFARLPTQMRVASGNGARGGLRLASRAAPRRLAVSIEFAVNPVQRRIKEDRFDVAILNPR
jgi:hypothetical protein